MDPLSIITAITSAQQIIGTMVSMAQQARQEGKLTEEQMSQIKSAASIADSEWDAVVQKAKAAMN